MSSKNTINSENSPGSINTIVNNKKSETDRTHEDQTLWNQTKWARWLLVTILTLIGLYFSYNQLMSNNNEINNINSPGSINTIGQTGGTNIVVNNNLNIPDPVITVEPINQNTEKEGIYVSEFIMNVETQVPIPNLYLQANTNSLISFGVLPQRSGPFMTGHSGKRNGFAFTNIPQAYGKYKLIVTTKQPEKVTFEGNID